MLFLCFLFDVRWPFLTGSACPKGHSWRNAQHRHNRLRKQQSICHCSQSESLDPFYFLILYCFLKVANLTTLKKNPPGNQESLKHPVILRTNGCLWIQWAIFDHRGWDAFYCISQGLKEQRHKLIIVSLIVSL